MTPYLSAIAKIKEGLSDLARHRGMTLGEFELHDPSVRAAHFSWFAGPCRNTRKVTIVIGEQE